MGPSYSTQYRPPSTQRPQAGHNPIPLPCPQLKQGTVCQLNLPSGYGFLKPTPQKVLPEIAASSVHPAQSVHTVASEQDRNVYFRVPSLNDAQSKEQSSSHTGFMTLQVGDTLEYICSQHSADMPRAIYTRLLVCSSRSEEVMASYLNHLLCMVCNKELNIEVIVQELVKVPQAIQLVLCHPKPSRKLILLVLRLAFAVCDQSQKTVTSSFKRKTKEFLGLLARSALLTKENTGLCKLLLELQKISEVKLPSFSALRWVSYSPKSVEVQQLEEFESEWGAPLATLIASSKALVLRILQELPKELPKFLPLIQTLNNIHMELQESADGKLRDDTEGSFAMHVIQAIAHTKGVEVDNLNVSWNKLSLLPLLSEIVDDPASSVHLPVAKLKGNYDSPDHYIDTYFRLLREDAFASLKKGIADFSNGRLDPRDMTVWFGVSAIAIHFEQSLPGIVVGLQLTNGQTNHSNSKLPLSGSLLCICDNGGCFRTPIWATAVRCELKTKRITVLFVELLKESSAYGIPRLKGLSSWPRILHATSMVVAESPAYYRAYEPVLKALQQLKAEEMPFQSELVLARSPGKPAEYLNSSTILNWSCLTDKDSCSTYGEVKAGINAPLPRRVQTSLDPTQLDAVNHVLQNQLAMIQGPPGTGKTFLSVKIVELLLSASTLPAKPVLIVTYKNKALDQFLESCLAFCTTKDIVRVGGKSKSDKLTNCNLHYLLVTGAQNKLSHSDWIANCDKLQTLQAELRQVLSSIHKCKNFNVETILAQPSSKGFMQKLVAMRKDNKLAAHHSEPANAKISNKILENISNQSTAEEGLPGYSKELLNRIVQKWIPQRSVFNCIKACLSAFSDSSARYKPFLNPVTDYSSAATKNEQEVSKDMQEDDEEKQDYDHLWGDIKSMHHTRSKDGSDTGLLSKNFLGLTDNFCAAKLFSGLSLVNFDLNEYCWLLEADPWELSSEHRGIVLLLIMQRHLEECMKTFFEIKEEYDQLCLENAEINKKRRVAILSEAKIIAMTTTGVAINQDILAAVSPAVVIVDEAAEILEPHLISLLSPSIKHLILVGDHKQLRPSVECHQLEVRHNLGISMLERLANNKLPIQTLGLQSRMREEFLPMIKPIYPELKSNLSVVNGEQNKPADCMKSTLYFWNHSVPEVAARSPSNKQEAHMVVALLKWLLSEGHKQHEITVICAYNGQVAEVRKMLGEDRPGEESVDVQTIDRFQGSENRIIIASLVRSNANRKIGHLILQSRLCVTVSRARSGFYICGNADTLSQASPHWKTLIDECFRAQSCLGDSIFLVCPRHPKDSPIRLHYKEAARFSPDVCSKPCNATLECDHCCTRTCHSGLHAQCKVEVPHIFPKCQHSILKQCSQPAMGLKCKEMVWVTLETCGHRKNCVCWEVTEQTMHAMACQLPCGKSLPCEHPCNLFCGEECGSKPCKTCAEIEKIKAQREKEQLMERIKEKMSIIDSEIKRLKHEPDEGPCFRTLHPENETAPEYHMVKDRTEKFIQPTHNIIPVVQKIEKVTNAKLQLRFRQAQKDLRDILQPTQLLFHGTDDEGVKGVTTHGFRLPSPDKKNMFGPGCYFATDSSNSAQMLYTKGSNKLLLCEVLIGKAWSLKSARPDLNHKIVRKEYDSVFSLRDSQHSGGTKFDEYVIYNTNQALPKYVIHYRNMDCHALTVHTLQVKANLPFERRVLDASTSSYRGDTTDEMHFRFAEAQFLRMSASKRQRVIKVEYIWNQVLYDRYQNVKQKFSAQNKPDDEILVFHGTIPESIDKIVVEGFKVGGTDGVEIRSGAAYGHGVYTAANPDTSIRYSAKGGMMLLSNAVCGKLGEDYNKGGSGDVYVVKRGDQLLPKYIVHFE
ncbi:hypothetical protein L7F22_005313 [Adiantum nelumboides]|nr:hypothetical protein [Adiantum nelumboides]